MYKNIRFIIKLIFWPFLTPVLIVMVAGFSVMDCINSKTWEEYKTEQKIQWSFVRDFISLK